MDIGGAEQSDTTPVFDRVHYTVIGRRNTWNRARGRGFNSDIKHIELADSDLSGFDFCVCNLFAAFVGVAFGYYPARKAAGLIR